ncbi:hypothetical protein MPTA5024_27805 [Microbispora sp. ATCC PTA-5024]|nr:hypothetical protein MPTA5024_27805 [Microbispora sp. ATCC PTA-5024]
MRAVCVRGRASGLPFWALPAIAATTGLGGGNFASSMANITHFYPAAEQGLPLALNAAGSFFLMNNLRKASSPYTAAEKWTISRRPQRIVRSVLYIGTFGSFIGYSFSFGVLIKSQFPHVDVSHFIWLGAFMRSVAPGGRLAGRPIRRRTCHDGRLPADGARRGRGAAALSARIWNAFLAAFLFVFAATGIGDGSTYRVIPAIFRAQAQSGVDAADPAAAPAAAEVRRRHAAAAIGISSAAGASADEVRPGRPAAAVRVGGGALPGRQRDQAAVARARARRRPATDGSAAPRRTPRLRWGGAGTPLPLQRRQCRGDRGAAAPGSPHD